MQNLLYMIAAVAAVFILWCIFIWIRDTNRFVTVEYQVEVAKLKKPFTFLFLSDLHNKSYGKGNTKLAEAIQKIPADAILSAGDMYTSKTGANVQNALSLFEKLAGKCPIYYANGNHEHKTRVKSDVFGTMYTDYWKKMEKFGVQLLDNEHVSLPEYGIDLYGLEIERDYFQRFSKRPFPENYLISKIGKGQEDRLRVLLAHNPDYFPEYAEWGVDVVVSGHVHGGVMRLPVLGGVISPAMRLFPKYDGGLFREKNAVMILGRGLGMHTIPVRLWNPAELVVVRLVPKKQAQEKNSQKNRGSLVKQIES